MLGTITPGNTSIPQDYSGGEYWDPNGGGMVESQVFIPANPDGSIPAAAPAPLASSTGAAGIFSAALQLGSLSIPYWLIAIPVGMWIFKGVR